MEKKWYNYFLTMDEPQAAAPERKPAGPKSAARPTSPTPPATKTPAQTVAEIASSVSAPPKFTAPVSNPSSFPEIYAAAEIRPPAHGYTIFKVADMLASEHIRNLPVEVKRSSVLVALDAAGVKLTEIIEDAVRRDRALDTYERVQQKSLEELETRKNEENRKIQAEIDRMVAEQRAKIQANNDQVSKERERFQGWQVQKQKEEQSIADAVAPFVSENPITTRAPSPASTAKKT